MGIALTDDHRELAEVARGFLTSHKARSAARSFLDAPEESRPPFWQGIVELGWLGLHIDEEHGGSGYGLPELVVVIDELGRAVAPGPFVPTVIASAVIAKDGTAEQKSRLLPGLIDGTITAGIGLDGQVRINDGVADGEAGLVFGAGLGDLLLVAAGDDVLVVERDRAGVSVEVPENLDPTRRSGRVQLQNVSVSDDDILSGARESALARARTLLAAEAVGGAADCVDAAQSPRFRRSSIIARTCWSVRSRRSRRYGMPPVLQQRTRTSSGWRPLRRRRWRFRHTRATRN
jgi:3-oxochol-4-en-24-oyl-CoA dehydrogenase